MQGGLLADNHDGLSLNLPLHAFVNELLDLLYRHLGPRCNLCARSVTLPTLLITSPRNDDFNFACMPSTTQERK